MTISNNTYQQVLKKFAETTNEMDTRHACQKTNKIWIVAMIVSTLILGVGVGGFATAGLLHSYGFQLPQSLQWLTPAIGTIGNTPHFAGLWAMVVGGGATTLAVIIAGVIKIRLNSQTMYAVLKTTLSKTDAVLLLKAIAEELFNKEAASKSFANHEKDTFILTEKQKIFAVKTHKEEFILLSYTTNEEKNALERILIQNMYMDSSLKKKY